MPSYRKEKLEELIRRVIAEALLNEIKDPRIGFATVTKVSLSRDLSVAEVGISVLGNETDVRKTMLGVNSAGSYVQYIVGKNIKMRNTPRIHFYLDTTIAEGVDMVGLIDSLDKSGDKDNGES